MKLTIKDLIRLRHCESHYRLGKLGLYAASKRTQFFYQKKDSLILALSKGPTSFSEALEKAFLEYSRDWSLITASMKPAGIRTLPGGIALLTGSLSRVIRF